ncbi:hypothetical protein cyc_06929 [Cyclospora cayetanensis]|uniref:Uncharacterized protein n=1 Tax=Cyclospora cayetanensis TaxID=88456 RepID=A0A1D3D7A5_9EIME|nr:hypothetical protein cyc_06929 [Cyclospora cayetanensis]
MRQCQHGGECLPRVCGSSLIEYGGVLFNFGGLDESGLSSNAVHKLVPLPVAYQQELWARAMDLGDAVEIIDSSLKDLTVALNSLINTPSSEMKRQLEKRQHLRRELQVGLCPSESADAFSIARLERLLQWATNLKLQWENSSFRARVEDTRLAVLEGRGSRSALDISSYRAKSLLRLQKLLTAVEMHAVLAAVDVLQEEATAATGLTPGDVVAAVMEETEEREAGDVTADAADAEALDIVFARIADASPPVQSEHQDDHFSESSPQRQGLLLPQQPECSSARGSEDERDGRERLQTCSKNHYRSILRQRKSGEASAPARRESLPSSTVDEAAPSGEFACAEAERRPCVRFHETAPHRFSCRLQ